MTIGVLFLYNLVFLCADIHTDIILNLNKYLLIPRYCNSRVMKFDKHGGFVMEIGRGNLWIPHSLALAEDKDLICVADREQQRYGEPVVLIHHGIVRRWRCGTLVTQRPLSLLLSMTYQLLLSMT